MTAADEPGAKARLKRTRTGCFKCRVRRRKCDEKKPSCQRCMDGGFDCQYGTKLSFLDKNTITSSGSSKPCRQSYSTLRFVDTRPSGTRSAVGSPQESPGPGLYVDETSRSPRLATEGSSDNQGGTSYHEGTVFSNFQPSTQGAGPPARPSHGLQTSGPYAVESSPGNAAYETALNVLLSLSTSSSGAPNGSNPRPRPRNNVSDITEPYPGAGFEPGIAEPTTSELVEQFSTCALLPQDRAVQLLRHYRYNVAPWLDIGDPAQTFGLEVSRLAMGSTPLFESLLSLAMTSLNRYAELDLKDIMATQSNESEITLLESLVVIAFAAVRQFAATNPREWLSPFTNIDLQSLDSALDHSDFFSIRMGVSWVLLRLDVSVGLLNSSTVSIPSLLPYGVTSPAASGISSVPLQYDREPLLLCAQVLNYCFAHDAVHSPGIHLGLGTTHRWKILSEALIMWYNKRPKESKPMLELDENDQLFPLILFSNGSAALANQMFHTAMLLLLQNRPRTLLNEHGRSVTMSPLWHAQRICGISMNNDSRQCWDFSLIGSLYVGAKRMTYEPQQQAILAGIDRISGITSWDLSSLTARLLQEWRPD